MRRILTALLIVLVCVIDAGPQTGSGTQKGTFFKAFPIGAAWTMVDAYTGYTTSFVVNSPGLNYYACFTPGLSALVTRLQATKTQNASWPNPGTANGENWFFFSSGAYNQYIFETQLNTSLTVANPTLFYFNPVGASPYGMLFQASATTWNAVSVAGNINACEARPGTFTYTWASFLTQENRTTPVYSGPVTCSNFTFISTAQTTEQWCFAQDPRGKFPPILVEVDPTIEAGTTVNIKLQTTAIASFPRT